MVRCVVGATLHGGPIELVLHNWCNKTDLDGAVAKSSTNGLVGTGFASLFNIQQLIKTGEILP